MFKLMLRLTARLMLTKHEVKSRLKLMLRITTILKLMLGLTARLMLRLTTRLKLRLATRLKFMRRLSMRPHLGLSLCVD